MVDVYHFSFEKKNLRFVISIKQHFHWYAHCIILSKSSLRFDDDITELLIVEKSKVSSEKRLKHNPCGK